MTVDGDHSESSAEYQESDSLGLNVRGNGKLRATDGAQVFERIENCNGDKCISSIDKGAHHL